MKSIERAAAQWTPVLMAAALCGGLAPPLARAGDPTSASTQAAQQEPQLAQVLVTAEKRSEPLQQVPMSVSALSGATLQAMGAEDFTDYARSIPGLTFTDAGAGRQTPAIRGINPSAGSGTVGYYIDETAIPGLEGGGVAINPTLVDVARIEVLRGPQGTLYGSGSIGGTIRVITNQPNLSTFEGYINATALATQGADGASLGGEGNLVLNVPVVKGIAAARAVFWYRDVGGFIDRTWTNSGTLGIATGPLAGKVGNLPDEHTWGTRTTLLFEPVAGLEVTAMVYLERQHYDGFNDITGGPDNPDDRLVQSFISDTPEPQENDFDLYSLTAKYDFGRLNLVSATSYFDRLQETSEEGTSLIQWTPAFFGDPAFGGALPNVGTFRQRVRNFSQETRLATSDRIAGFDALVGVFYSQAHDPRSYDYYPPDYDQIVAGNDPADPAYAPGGNAYTASGPGYHERQVAEFGELTYHFTDALSLTGGLRHYDVSNRFQLDESGLLIGGNVPGVTNVTDVSSSAQGNVYKGNLSYRITPHHMVYAQYAEGFRPGFGREPVAPECGSEASGNEVKPDSIRSYEVGAKTDWLQKRLIVDAAAYRIDWNDIQEQRLLPCGFGVADNFGDAVIKGAELEARARLTGRIDAGFSATYLHTELLQGSALSGALAGDPIEYVPNWQYALYAQTTLPVFATDDGFARIDYQYTGSSITDYSRLAGGGFDPSHEVQVVRRLDARIGERIRAWEFALSVTNLLDDTVRQSLDPNASITIPIPGRPRYVVTRPRTFSLSATYDF